MAQYSQQSKPKFIILRIHKFFIYPVFWRLEDVTTTVKRVIFIVLVSLCIPSSIYLHSCKSVYISGFIEKVSDRKVVIIETTVIVFSVLLWSRRNWASSVAFSSFSDFAWSGFLRSSDRSSKRWENWKFANYLYICMNITVSL